MKFNQSVSSKTTNLMSQEHLFQICQCLLGCNLLICYDRCKSQVKTPFLKQQFLAFTVHEEYQGYCPV